MMDDTDPIPSPASSSSASVKSKDADYFTTEEFDEAVALGETRPQVSASTLLKIVTEVDANAMAAAKTSRMREEAIYQLGKIYARTNDVPKIKELMVQIRPYFNTISKPRSAKIIRSLIDEISKMPKSASFLVEVCLDAIAWCEKEKRSFLRQRIQARLAALYADLKRYKEALQVIKRLVKEIKKFDDKPLMVEISLTEAFIYFDLQNIPKSKGALTAARSNANAFYCPPAMQAQIDLHAGVLSAAERDFKTAFSYFYEAFEGFSTINDTHTATRALKYMLLSKIMGNQATDVNSIINSKGGLRFAGVDVDAMKAIANAHKAASIHVLAEVLDKYRAQLLDDPIIKLHVSSLQENLLEANIRRVVEPFSRVQISHVAELMELPLPKVEAKLSQMILDKKLSGILDQGSGDLVLVEESQGDSALETSLQLIKELEGCVTRLYTKTQKLARS